MAQLDLARSVPYAGLSDVSKRPPNAHRTPNRVLRILHEYTDKRMPTLRGIAQDDAGHVDFLKRKEERGGGKPERWVRAR